jgi:hypothetical protein
MINEMRRMGASACAALVFMLAPACGPSTTPEEHQGGMVHHVVLCWLKDTGNVEHIETIVDQTLGFASQPGIVSVVAGTSLASDRPLVDDSFDVGLIMVFESQESLAAYLADPEHQRATEEILRPLVDRLVIYDIVEGHHPPSR